MGPDAKIRPNTRMKGPKEEGKKTGRNTIDAFCYDCFALSIAEYFATDRREKDAKRDLKVIERCRNCHRRIRKAPFMVQALPFTLDSQVAGQLTKTGILTL